MTQSKFKPECDLRPHICFDLHALRHDLQDFAVCAVMREMRKGIIAIIAFSIRPMFNWKSDLGGRTHEK
jgi:hypothetical protein